MPIQAALIAIGQKVAVQLGRAWFSQKSAEAQRSSDLSELVAFAVPDQFKRRKLVRQLAEIGDSVAERIGSYSNSELGVIPENEQMAAMAAVADTLAACDLSDTSLFEANLDSRTLTKYVRAQGAPILRSAALSEAAERLYEQVLRDTCTVLLQLVLQVPAFDARATAELLRRVADLSVDTDEILRRLPPPSLDAPVGTSLDEDFRVRYVQFVSDTLDHLELFGVDTRNYQPHTPVSVSFLSLQVRREKKRSDEPSSGTGQFEDGYADRVDAALGTSRRLLIRGDAGSGKTTLLQWLAVSSARSTFEPTLHHLNGLTPVLVRLRSYSDGMLPQPDAMLSGAAGPLASIAPKGWLHRQFEQNRAFLLIDGVDEVRSSRRAAVKQWLRQLLLVYPRLQIIVTSRPAAASSTWLEGEGFASVDLEPMTAVDVAVFCRRWHQAIRQGAVRKMISLPCESSELASYEAALTRQLESRRHLGALATNPLMCAMLCALNLDRRKNLPPDRMRLYGDAINLLIDRRDTERDLIGAHDLVLDTSTKIALLQQLAWRLSDAGRSEASRQSATSHIKQAMRHIPTIDADAAQALDYLIERSGIVREPSEGRIDFVHRTFQEYLAAKEAADEHLVDSLVHRAHLDLWRETIVMAAGHFTGDNRNDLISGLLNRSDQEPSRRRKLRLLAASCLETATYLDPSVIERTDEQLSRLVPPRSKREGRSLAMAGDRVIRFMPAVLDGLSDTAAANCIWTAAYVGTPRSMEHLGVYAQYDKEEAQRALLEAWQYFDAEEYSKTVLADAPLLRTKDGRPGLAEVREVALVRYCKNLQRLGSLYLHIPLGQGVLDLDFAVGAPALENLRVWPDKPVDLAPVGSMEGLRRLVVFANGAYTGFSHLEGLPHLEELALSFRHVDWGNIKKIFPLAGRVTELAISEVGPEGKLADLGPFLPHLKSLDLYNWRATLNLDVLRGSSIEHLEIIASRISNLDAVAEMPRLRSLWLAMTEVGDLTPVISSSISKLVIRDPRGTLDVGPLREVERPLTLYVPKEGEIVGLDSLNTTQVRLRRARW